MGKRKRDRRDQGSEIEHLKRKYKKLKERYDESRERRRRSTSSPSSNERLERRKESTSPTLCDERPTRPPLSYASDLEISMIPDDPTEEVEPPCGQQEGAIEVESDDLDPEIQALLGDDLTEENLHGKELHKDLAKRWQHTLLKGLPKEEKSVLIKAHLPPKNCSALIPPKLNLEVEGALNEIEKKKDTYSRSKQAQLSSCLAAIGATLNTAVTSKDKTLQTLIKPLSDASRLLCDAYHRETLSRRFTIANSLNRQMRDTIKNTEVDEFLFGSALSKHLESSKAISKSANELKQNRPFKKNQTQAQTQQTTHNNLNARGGLQPTTSDGRTSNPNSYYRRPPPPPPPPPRQGPAPTPRYHSQPKAAPKTRHRYRDRRRY